MSKQAIKTYFENSRRTKKLRRVAPIEDVKVEEIYIVDQSKLEEAFEHLQNLDMLYDDQILYYVSSLDEEEYEYVLSRKKELSPELQNLIWPEAIKLNCSTKVKLVNLTDQMQTDIMMKQLKEQNRKLDELCAKEVIPPRPSGQLDLKLTSLKEKLVNEENNLETVMKNIKPKTYVPPAMRQKMAEVDPKVLEVKNNIQKIKNEITSVESSIEKENARWKDDRAYEIRQKLKFKMLELS